MLKIRRPRKEYNHNEILNFVRSHEIGMHRELVLEAYYKGNNAINKTIKAEGKANHKVAHPFAHQIVSTMVGYFASEPVQFDMANEQVKDEIDNFLKYNDFDRIFTRTITDSCVYGVGAMMLFLDGEGKIRFANVDVKELIVLVDNTVLEEVHTVIRHWQCENNDGIITRYIEVYDNEKVRKFYMEDREVASESVEPHYFGDVPFTFFYLNAEQMGIFERVIPLIDAYDTLESETLNLASDLSDAILLVAGCELGDDEVAMINEMRLLNVPDTSESNVVVEYVTKDGDNNESTKQRLRDDIFSLSMVSDVNAKDFGQALSGSALKLRLSSQEFLASVLEGYAKLGLRRLIELYCNVSSLTGGINVDVISEMNIRLTRNTVSNENEQIQQALQLSTLLSKETVLSLLQGFVPDVETELERLNEEREEAQSFMDGMDEEEHIGNEPKDEEEEEESKEKEDE